MENAISIEQWWFTAREAAEYARCHWKTVVKAAEAGELEGVQKRPGCRWRFHRDAIEAWMRGEVPQPAPRSVAA